MLHFLRAMAVLFMVALLSSWGFLAHRTINQLAIYELPGSMRPFFYYHKAYLVQHSVRPDLRRSEDSAEATRHFIDLEKFGADAAQQMPLQWSDAVARYTADSLRKYGYVPYYVVLMKDRLTGAFRRKQADSILFYAADLAHYISDAHVPLHTTENYDGQLTGQNGIHALWETVVPELELDNYRLSSRHGARYLRNPSEAIWQSVREANALLPEMFAREKAVTTRFTDSTKYRIQIRRGKEVKYYTSAFAKAYSEALGNSINQQLVRSADMVADFWYTAWKDAGEPDLAELIPSFPSATRDQMKRELHAFRKNQLISRGWLMARQPQENTP